jgi:hypothetical protein
MKDLYHSYKVAPAFGPVARPAGAGIAVDLQGFEAALFVFQSGAMGAVAATYTWKLTECDEVGGSYTDVAAADMIEGIQTVVFDQAVGADANAAKKLGYIGSKRFIKVYSTEGTAGTPTSIIGASAILGHARHNPVA